ncbi:Fic family protein [Anaerococcus murdochii]|uniref:Fic family protein n=1 Tax=Anaerococcus murdochii TaxID=411577 RepID=A0ABS7SZV8_9FIRM|nr:Fic family protein [Anaerococcus murdochii]MBZ2387037.1 Fic family protein [Anaerococcus murdochii]
MREFNYSKLLELNIPANMYDLIAKIYEYKGKQELYVENFSDVLEKMVEVAKIQSTKSSNAIEGISTNDGRLEELMKKKSVPRNRNEEEIYGYREVLDIIHENYENIEITKNNILTLHNRLYSYSGGSHKGKFKSIDNSIVETNVLGEKRIRFQPVSAFETESYIDKLISAYDAAINLKIPPLLLIPVVVHDFLCIHPFFDGNGRMSRLITLLLLYKNGFFVGKYISLEMIIEDTKDSYYEELQASSENWHSGTNDELPFIKYMLSVIYKAYSECDERFRLIGEKSLTSAERVLKVFDNTLEALSKSDIVILCPDISKRTIERALKELSDGGLIKQIGSGRATKYIKVEGLYE